MINIEEGFMSVLASSVVDQVSAALSVANLKHEVIASNIANRDTEGYRRLAVSFDQAMHRANVVALDPQAEPVSMEQDLVALSSNAGNYVALARVLNRYFAIVGDITAYNRG
jgi:flagellar basal body rod protein FlgB